MNSALDTIAAIATASGDAGISIVRISGPLSLEIADKIFLCSDAPPSQRAAGTFVHGFIRNEESPSSDSNHTDEVIVLIYRAPHSYTKEDVVEIQGHGGRICSKQILRLVLNLGARMAEPGEFTKRAFLNGRIDLLQAEAVADLIRAQSDRAAAAAIEQLDGALSSQVARCYTDLIDATSDVEATLNFAEEELQERTGEEISAKLDVVVQDLQRLLNTWQEGHLLREGAIVVISGCPNVGKSTLLNRLLGTERAIVADQPGTTRDTIEEQMVFDGVPLRLVDTAGLRESECSIEREGVRRARAFIEKADLNIHVIDGSQPLSTTDRSHVFVADTRKCLIILNKNDLGIAIPASGFLGFLAISCSMTTGEGLGSIRQAIIEKLDIHSTVPPHAVISERHRKYIQNALNETNSSTALLRDGRTNQAVFVAQHLRIALESLGSVIGMTYTDDLLDNIFKRFCLGK